MGTEVTILVTLYDAATKDVVADLERLGYQAAVVAADHEHCANAGKCWQDREPCPELGS